MVVEGGVVEGYSFCGYWCGLGRNGLEALLRSILKNKMGITWGVHFESNCHHPSQNRQSNNARDTCTATIVWNHFRNILWRSAYLRHRLQVSSFFGSGDQYLNSSEVNIALSSVPHTTESRKPQLLSPKFKVYHPSIEPLNRIELN